MSEKSLSNNESRYLNDLDKALSDPFIETTLQTARTYNEIFSSTIPDEGETDQIIRELDASWGTLIGEPVTFTGIIRSTNDQFEPFFLDGKDVMSNGFCIVTNENGGTEEGPRVQYHLMMNANLIEEDADPRLMLSATADIDLSILQFSAASPERAAAWLASSFPDFMEELDARLMNTPSGDDDEAIMSLRGLRIPSEITEEDQFTRNCIAIYINRSVCTDQSVPYLVSMSGLASVYSPQGISTVYISNMNNRLFTAHAVHIERLIIDDDNSEYVLKLSGSFISDARDEEDVRMSIPITTFSKIKSIRNKYHS